MANNSNRVLTSTQFSCIIVSSLNHISEAWDRKGHLFHLGTKGIIDINKER